MVAAALFAAAAAINVMRVTMADAAEKSFDCVIDPSESAKLGSPVSGILAKVLVDRGDYVAKDQEVAELESTVEVATVAYDKFRASSTAAIDAQKARVELAKDRLQRGNDLMSKKSITQLISEDELDQRRAQTAIEQQDLVREQQTQQLAQLDLAKDQATLNQRSIRSPMDGTITEKKLSAGEFVNQDGYIVTVARLDPLHVETYLPVSTYGHINVGTSGTVYPDPPIGGKYNAAVIVVDSVFDPSSGTYGVRLNLPNPDRTLPGGQRCKVGFDLPTE